MKFLKSSLPPFLIYLFSGRQESNWYTENLMYVQTCFFIMIKKSNWLVKSLSKQYFFNLSKVSRGASFLLNSKTLHTLLLLFSLFFHIGKSEILLKSKILLVSNMLKSKNYCKTKRKIGLIINNTGGSRLMLLLGPGKKPH